MGKSKKSRGTTSAISNYKKETNDFDKIKTVSSGHRQSVKKLHTHATMPM